MKEIEDKYLIKNLTKEQAWDKEFIIYQWYIEKNNDSSTKLKIIFDLKKLTCIFVRIRKYNIGYGKCEKEVEYLTERDFSWDKLTKYPFIMKHRSIRDRVFLDHFLRSNQICEFLLEVEYLNEKEMDGFLEFDEFSIEKKVTEDERYLNQNMTVAFEDRDKEFLMTILQIFNREIPC